MIRLYTQYAPTFPDILSTGASKFYPQRYLRSPSINLTLPSIFPSSSHLLCWYLRCLSYLKFRFYAIYQFYSPYYSSQWPGPALLSPCHYALVTLPLVSETCQNPFPPSAKNILTLSPLLSSIYSFQLKYHFF